MKYAKQYFDNHSTVNVLYFTSDNLAFFEEQNAQDHATHLDDDTVISMTRKEAAAAIKDISKEGWGDVTDFDPLDEFDAE